VRYRPVPPLKLASLPSCGQWCGAGAVGVVLVEPVEPGPVDRECVELEPCVAASAAPPPPASASPRAPSASVLLGTAIATSLVTTASNHAEM
jgi:hypothetical protein